MTKEQKENLSKLMKKNPRKSCKRCGAWLNKRGKCIRDHNKMTYKRVYERVCDYCGKKYKGRGAQFCSRKCNSVANSPFIKGNKHPGWKGDDVGVYALHEWVANRKPKPTVCESCKKNKPYDLSSNEHTYTRNPQDWEWLCRSCHRKKDIKWRKESNG